LFASLLERLFIGSEKPPGRRRPCSRPMHGDRREADRNFAAEQIAQPDRRVPDLRLVPFAAARVVRAAGDVAAEQECVVREVEMSIDQHRWLPAQRGMMTSFPVTVSAYDTDRDALRA